MKRLLLLAVLALSPGLALADQFQWLARDQAVTAQATVAEVAIVRHYCKPCGDQWSRAESVHEVDVAPVAGESDYWNVMVNGEAVDLAYVYVPRDGEWRNLALLLGLDASDVPASLAYPQLEAGHEDSYD